MKIFCNVLFLGCICIYAQNIYSMDTKKVPDLIKELESVIASFPEIDEYPGKKDESPGKKLVIKWGEQGLKTSALSLIIPLAPPSDSPKGVNCAEKEEAAIRTLLDETFSAFLNRKDDSPGRDNPDLKELGFPFLGLLKI